jgi:D-alanine--poly(phosphoribitol) ligase subunit 1
MIKNIIETICKNAYDFPNSYAHISGEDKLTYKELNEKSNILANYLIKHYPDTEGQPILILGHKQNEMLIGFLGAVKSAHPYIPIDSSMPEDRIATINESANTLVMLTTETIKEIVKSHKGSEVPLDRAVTKNKPYYIIFTSGSTGQPKGVVITQNNLASFVNWQMDEHKYKPSTEVFLNQAPFSFDLSVNDLYCSLCSGNTLYSITKDDISNPKQLYTKLGESGITTWVSTPSFVDLCLAEPTFNDILLPQLKRFWFCGETLSHETAVTLAKRFNKTEIWNTYGPTETTVAVTSVKITKEILEKYNPLPLGIPKKDTRIDVIKKEDGSNEIIITGDSVSPGYLGKADLTKKAFYKVDGIQTYKTGDSGYFSDNMLFFTGRIDNQIKLHGFRIELGDIETHIQALTWIRDTIVLVKNKDLKNASLCAFIILDKNNYPLTEKETTNYIKNELSKSLPVYMIPRKYIFIDKYPITQNGKADRKKLLELA